MGRARGANAKLNGKFEATYGVVPSGNFIQLPFVSSSLGEERGLIASDLLGQGREPYDPTEDVSSATGDIVVPVDVRNIGHWLKLLLGAPTSAVISAGTKFGHTFQSGAAALPSIALEIGNPDVPSFGMNFGCLGNMIRIAMARSGLLNATIGLIGQGESPLVATSAAGTPTNLAVDRFAQATGAVKKDGAALGDVVSADFQFMNNLDPVEVIREDGRIAGADPGMVAGQGSVVLRFKDRDLYNQAVGTPLELSFGWTKGEHSLIFTYNRVFLPKAKREVSGPNGIQSTHNWQASGADGGVLTVVLTNDVASYAA